MTSTSPDLDAVGPSISLRLPPLPGAGDTRATRETSAERLPPVDLSAIPGARVTLRYGVEADGVQLRAFCATAPSDRWAPGVEELVLDRASGLVRSTVAGTVERWEGGPIATVGPRFEQRFEGAARDGGAAATIRGRHALGFAGEERAAVLCSVVCVELAEAQPRRCAELIDGARVEGAFVSAPAPGLLVRGILFAAERPYPAAAGLALAAAAGVALLVTRRPRRPW